MDPLKEYHHFKKDMIESSDRVSRSERYVVDLLLNSKLSDSQRESSIAFELKHHAAVTQMARILAQKRSLPVDVCSIGAALHDIYVIVDGKYQDHAHLGGPIATDILHKIGGFTEDEISMVWRIVYHHSDKQIWSEDPFQEIGKDADVIDCFLYPNAFGFYLRHKPLPIFVHYLIRAKNAWHDLNIPQEPGFDLLKNYNSSWFNLSQDLDQNSVVSLLSILLALTALDKKNTVFPPAFCITSFQGKLKFHTNEGNWQAYLEQLDNARDLLRDYFHQDTKLGGDPWAALGQPIVLYLNVSQDIKPLYNASTDFVNAVFKAQAVQLIAEVQQCEGLLMFWPAIDAYEMLGKDEMSGRVNELGISGLHQIFV